nr:RHS repeat-associated core domain-containing protein [Comamonas sp. B21-038]
MAGGLITRIEDLAGRSVSYQWAGQRLAQVTDVMGHAWKYEYDANGQITSRTDPLGLKISAQYIQSIPAPEPMLSLGKKGVTIDPTGTSGTTQKLANLWGGGRVGQFDGQSGCASTGANNYLRERRVFEVTYTDCRGNATVTQYDLQGNELSRTFNGKKTASNQWDGAYHQKYTNARGYSTTTTYDSNYQPLQITHPDGSVEKYTYEPVFGRQSSYTNQLGVVSTWRYDSKGNVTEWVEAKGLPEQRTTLYTYDQHSQLTSSTKGAGDATQADAITQSWQYDSAGNVTAQTDGEGHTRRIAYDQRGVVTTYIDALNRVTRFELDEAGNVTNINGPAGESTKMRYNSRGKKIQIISPQNNISNIIYDEKGQVVEFLAPGEIEGAGRKALHDDEGRVIQSISQSGLTAFKEYDEEGRLILLKDPAGGEIHYKYGSSETEFAGLLTETKYPTYKESYNYDQIGRRTLLTQHLESGEIRTYSQLYNGLGQVVQTTDGLGKTSSVDYDGLGRVVLNVDPTGQKTHQTWDAFDQLTSVTDSNGNTHRFEYNKSQRMVKELDPLGNAKEYFYDSDGQLKKQLDAAGNALNYEYNGIGKKIFESHRGSGDNVEETIEYKYDSEGHMTGYVQLNGQGDLLSSASYDIDPQGRVVEANISYGKIDSSEIVKIKTSQSFNLDGQLASHTYPGGGLSEYIYENGRLSEIKLPNGKRVFYGEYKWNMPTKISMPGSTKVVTFDELQRPLDINIQSSLGIAEKRSYKYDLAGKVSEVKNAIGVIEYKYDDADRLVGVIPDQNLINNGLPLENYSYDAVHNRISSSVSVDQWKYNKNNQLTEYPGREEAPHFKSSTTLVSYNNQGHTTEEKNGIVTKKYLYNSRGKMIRYIESSAEDISRKVESHYRYDPMGRRISKTINIVGGEVKTTYYVYGESGLMGELDDRGLMQKAYGFNPMSAERNSWSTDPIWQAEAKNPQDGILKMREDDVYLHFIHTNNIGLPIIAFDEKGAVSWQGVSEGFGFVSVLESSDIEMNLRYPGQYFDVESNLHYNFNRYYSPATGRYLEWDPLGLEAGVNQFVYAMAQPINLIDSYGLAAKGYWVKEPEIAKPDFRLFGFRRINVYVDIFGFVNFFSLDFRVSGAIDYEVRCIIECPYEEFYKSSSIPLSFTGQANSGPNIWATLIGLLSRDPAKAAFANAALTSARIAGKINEVYGKYYDVAKSTRDSILNSGPDEICNRQ